MTTYRTLGIACAAAFLALAATSANAKICSTETFVGTGSGSKVDASNGALLDWTKKVKAELGGVWINYSLATAKSSTCRQKDPSIKLWTCRLSARPCKPGFVIGPSKPGVTIGPK